MSIFSFGLGLPGDLMGSMLPPIDSEASLAGNQSAAQSRQAGTDLEARVDRLTLGCLAMWTLLKECTDLTEEDLMERVRQLDLRDGTLDGKIAKQAKRCPKCNRVMSPQHSRCLYCGAIDLQATIFDEAL